jgi:hypothetical protein
LSDLPESGEFEDDDNDDYDSDDVKNVFIHELSVGPELALGQ